MGVRLKTRTFAAIVTLGITGGALGQQLQQNARVARPLLLNQTRYRFHAGDSIRIDAPQETRDFIRTAKSRTASVDGKEARGFVIAPTASGNDLLVAASLTTPPGEYTLNVSAVNDAGEMRMAPMNIVLDPMAPVPSNATRPPVVLLNGWQEPSLTQFSTCPPSVTVPPSKDTFGNLESDLIQSGVPVVYFFDNCVEDPNAKIEQLGNDLFQVLGLIRYDTGAPVPLVDLVAHSMGGL